MSAIGKRIPHPIGGSDGIGKPPLLRARPRAERRPPPSAEFGGADVMTKPAVPV